MNKIKLYILESYNELVHNVTWPDWASLLHSTKIVLISSLLISITVMIMDFLSKGLMTNIYNINL